VDWEDVMTDAYSSAGSGSESYALPSAFR
jgi:hypothetical protein